MPKKYYTYPAKGKGSLEITQAKIICKNCIKKRFSEFNKDTIDRIANSAFLMEGKNFEEALKVLESDFDKKSEANWYTKGNMLANLEKWEEALKCYDEALFLDTHYIKAWYRKGHILLSMKKYMDSAKCFENVVGLEGGGNTGRKLTGWGFPAAFCCMMAHIFSMRELANRVKLSEEVCEPMFTWINRCRPLLTRALPLHEDDHGNLEYVTLVPPELDIPQFYEYCVTNFHKILDSIEPRVVVEFKPLEYFEKEH